MIVSLIGRESCSCLKYIATGTCLGFTINMSLKLEEGRSLDCCMWIHALCSALIIHIQMEVMEICMKILITAAKKMSIWEIFNTTGLSNL